MNKERRLSVMPNTNQKTHSTLHIEKVFWDSETPKTQRYMIISSKILNKTNTFPVTHRRERISEIAAKKLKSTKSHLLCLIVQKNDFRACGPMRSGCFVVLIYWIANQSISLVKLCV